MKKLIADLALLALVPVFSPATADALTGTAREQARSEAGLPPQGPRERVHRLRRLRRPGRRTERDGQLRDDANTTADPSAIDNPDGLTDVGAVTGVDWAFTDLPPDYFVLAIRADNMNVPHAGCARKFGLQPTPGGALRHG